MLPPRSLGSRTLGLIVYGRAATGRAWSPRPRVSRRWPSDAIAKQAYQSLALAAVLSPTACELNDAEPDGGDRQELWRW